MIGNWRIIIGILFFSAVMGSVTAQKGKGDFVQSKNEGWLVEVNEAYELSAATDKPILANFTGSDWCGWCKRLKAEVFSKPEFKAWAEENVVLLELDYPRRTKLPDAQRNQNVELQKAFQVGGFPTIWMFDLTKPNGQTQFNIEAYGKTGYVQGGPEAFIAGLEKMLDNKN